MAQCGAVSTAINDAPYYRRRIAGGALRKKPAGTSASLKRMTIRWMHFARVPWNSASGNVNETTLAFLPAGGIAPEVIAQARPVLGRENFIIGRELLGNRYLGKPRGIETLPDGERRGIDTQTCTSPETRRTARFGFTRPCTRGCTTARARHRRTRHRQSAKARYAALPQCCRCRRVSSEMPRPD